jgi:hypothetical protein
VKKLLIGLAASLAMPAAASAAPFVFTPGNLVVSVYGQVDASGAYAFDNAASPIFLQQLTTAGALAGGFVLPQVASTVGGVVQNAISGEYGSSSEGVLQLTGDGHALTLMGYGVNANTFNTGGATVYGNAALAQSTSVPGGTLTPVSRVVALVGADSSVDTSTGLFNFANTNNPRSVYSASGTSFYVSGQGVKGDTTQGVFLAQKGASSATAITTATDTRNVVAAGGTLYASVDSKQTTRPTIESLGASPTGTTTPVPLTGIGPSITVTAASANGVNVSRMGNTVYLSPDQFFFADASTLYIADSGVPKNGSAGAAGLGDGGLQKWVLANGTWSLAYTLSAGLNLVAGSAASGTTGLFGLAGQVSGDSVSLFATNYTAGDLDQSYVYGITDRLSAGAPQAGEAFSTIYTAAANTKVRGVSFAPTLAATAAVPEAATWATMILGMGAVGVALRRRRQAAVRGRVAG